MKGERLFRILGLVDDDLIEEAVSASSAAASKRRRTPWRALGLAACLALVCGLGLFWFRGGGLAGIGFGGSAGNASSGDSGIAADGPLSTEGTAFMFYAGPVFPLTTLEEDAGLTAERALTWDFTPGTHADGTPRRRGATVADRYILTNPGPEAVTVTALYPFAGSFRELADLRPAVTVDGVETDAVLYAGAYAGGFQGVWQSVGQLDGSTLNLAPPGSWTDYKALLESGDYLAQALGDAPALDQPVTVYEFADFEAPHGEYDAATQAIEFTIDQEKTTVLTYGFNGGSWDPDTGWQRHSYFVPNGVRREPEKKVLAVLGEDIGDYTLTGYKNGGCNEGEEIEGVSCTVTRREITLDTVLDELCRYFYEDYAEWQYGMADSTVEAVSYPLFRRAASELLTQYGVLSREATVDRYADGRLDDILSEALSQERVLYLSVPVTVPAGGSVDITFKLWKAPSFDYGCSGSENAGLQGYDLVTRLGSNLDFTRQTAAVANTEGVELVRQNLGFDLAAGVTSVELDPAEEHYYLEIRPAE